MNGREFEIMADSWVWHVNVQQCETRFVSEEYTAPDWGLFVFP